MSEVNPLLKAALELEQAAERVRQMVRELYLPADEYTPSQALQRLRAALGPNAYVAVDPPRFHWHAGADVPTVGRWCVYDGRVNYEAHTLAQALNDCLAANKPEEEEEEDPDPDQAVADAEAVLAAATAMPF